MATRVVIYTYDYHSEGAGNLRTALQDRLGVKVDWVGRSGQGLDTVKAPPNCIICWGNVGPYSGPTAWHPVILNKWGDNVVKANKLAEFKRLTVHKVPTVPWTTSQADAQKWGYSGHVVLCRSVLSGDNSVGIEVYQPKKVRTTFYGPCDIAAIGQAKPYTQFVPHQAEYRIHVTTVAFIDGLEKKKLPTCNPYVFDQDHGLFCRDGVVIPQVAINTAKAAVAALGLTFGAVDVLMSGGQPLVLEVNTAPGLLPSEARNYAKIFQKHGYV